MCLQYKSCLLRVVEYEDREVIRDVIFLKFNLCYGKKYSYFDFCCDFIE
ncbi:hypothetical protein HMPREF9699_01259 [Bergeyella zoohelcum ATCC 43767]|uniref:Uncharacterized protein n=1 Tax=Bergeyella zoohelcum ATCC 43767 TaxID=883096 RepID=K1LQ20_9FLAO|nr:hypothetical protein HMPREF9699_01259 [Bergeyella zoohelcum ATCC 43767]SUV48561.1 Uncharacterised protein [Bergeyella zoohelcum]